ncbi:MAG: hypothetical protein ACK5P7_03910 [Bdellovibrio sp.]
MDIESRSYNPGSFFRPKPYILSRPESHLLILTTSWTSHSEAERAARMILEQVEQTEGNDATSISEKNVPSVEVGNKLKSALHMTSQSIYKQDNSKQARLLIEALVIQRHGQLMSWAQVGQPNLYLIRKGRVAPLAASSDLSIFDPQLPPLPLAGLGLSSHTSIQTGSARIAKGDQLLFWRRVSNRLGRSGARTPVMQP